MSDTEQVKPVGTVINLPSVPPPPGSVLTVGGDGRTEWKPQPISPDLPPDCTLRVRGGNPNDPDPQRRPTDPIGLSRSLLKVLLQNPERVVRLQCVGPVAYNIAGEAFGLAAADFEKTQHGFILVNRQSTYTATVGGRNAKGKCWRIFPVPIKYAL
jgi:hypothetical protein